MTVRIHNLLPLSLANGPGQRYVVWFQGCSLACRNCFNPTTHDRTAGKNMAVDDIVDDILKQGSAISGVTISGGEPFQQPVALLALVKRLKTVSELSVLVFSGYRMKEIERDPVRCRVLENIDILVAGRYLPSRHQGSGLLGSSNQILHFLSNRYIPEDFDAVPHAEILISTEGRLSVTGIDAPDLSFCRKKAPSDHAVARR